MVTMYFNDLNFRNIIGVSATGHWLTEKDKKKTNHYQKLYKYGLLHMIYWSYSFKDFNHLFKRLV